MNDLLLKVRMLRGMFLEKEQSKKFENVPKFYVYKPFPVDMTHDIDR